MRRLSIVLLMSLILVVGMSFMVGAMGPGFGFCCDEGDFAKIEQFGKYNDATIVQTGQCYGPDYCLGEWFTAPGNNMAMITQHGKGHDAVITQTGAMNFASVRSDGKDQEVTIRQEGRYQMALVNSHGYRNDARVVQKGAKNFAAICQGGAKNDALIRQLGTKDVAMISQHGYRNDATIVQH
ncbi:Curlin associated repeat-containing protein [Halanaerobium congolense]|jgi:hypothetical protein|uniref:Curlin associated repeat-containing protein n=1 Tax=Halanaerobium congolense TaxID=54121 RepID=A0A1I0BSY7_9FIRM|nr:hypothetical protein [Halanaerobium congolense]PTX15429.1 hypothetical protein C7953_0064 [Halanaerobium congolense]TDP15591.1 hypothetical protein C8C79_11933 [Halanaerobium congolense]SDF81070.1 Curlin associated repeat-containing protein [Halanaerobium congolense]SET10028.1 Curlin associated repeat-containing protein [Halanaerobium congolense]SFP51563.1 Curlin associated repeat-containing protein [Halanaerobium congolense]